MSRLSLPLHSLRLKLGIVSAAAIFCSGAGGYWLMSEAAERQALDQFREEAEVVGAVTALETGPRTASDNRAGMTRVLADLGSDPDFRSAHIQNASGEIISSMGGRADCGIAPGPHQKTQIIGSRLAVMTPIIDSGRTWGYVCINLSLERTQAMLTRLRSHSLGCDRRPRYRRATWPVPVARVDGRPTLARVTGFRPSARARHVPPGFARLLA